MATFAEMETRVRQLIQDVGSDLYPPVEVAAALNDAKDEVFAIHKTITGQNPLYVDDIAFIADAKDASLSGLTNFEGSTTKIEKLGGTNNNARSYNLVPFQDEFNTFNADNEMMLYQDETGTWFLRRKFFQQALTIRLYYHGKMADLVTGSASSFIMPAPADNLIQYKAANILLPGRLRPPVYERRETKLEVTYREVLQGANKVEARTVRLIPW